MYLLRFTVADIRSYFYFLLLFNLDLSLKNFHFLLGYLLLLFLLILFLLQLMLLIIRNSKILPWRAYQLKFELLVQNPLALTRAQLPLSQHQLLAQ